MSKRKANNPLKRKQQIARKVLKDLAVVMVLGKSKYCTVMNLRTLKEVVVQEAVAELITDMAWPWRVECSIACRDQNGVEYVVSEEVHCESAYRQSDPRLNDFLNNHHRAFLAKQNPLHVITLAWVIMPCLGDVNELPLEKLNKIYTQLGAFEHLSKWESLQNNENPLLEQDDEHLEVA